MAAEYELLTLTVTGMRSKHRTRGPQFVELRMRSTNTLGRRACISWTSVESAIREASIRPVWFPCCCENWMLTDSMLHQLESFQGEIGRRILRLSKYHSTLFYSFGSESV